MNKNSFLHRARQEAHDAWHNKRPVAIVYFLLRLSVILVLIAQIFNRNFENAFLCVLTLFLFTVPTILQRRLHIEFPDTLEIIVLLFIYAAEILGEIEAYYVAFPYWDTVLHTLNGFLCAAIGFSLLDVLNRQSNLKFHLSPFYLALMAFCFSMTVGVCWEFFEFTMDKFFLLDMQKDKVVHAIGSIMLDPAGGNHPTALKNITDVVVVLADGTHIPLALGGYLDIGLIDTMEDLFVNFIGALVFSVIGFLYLRGRGKGNFVKRFIPIPSMHPAAKGDPETDSRTEPRPEARVQNKT